MKRRTLLLAGTTAAGALVVGWGAMPQRSRLGAGTLMRPAKGEVALNGWIKIGADGAVVLAMPRCEMGQGVHTALSMLAAEELDVPLATVRLEQAAADTLYGNVAFTVDALPFHPSEIDEQVDGFSRVQFSRRLVGKFAREIGINATGGSSTIADLWMPVRTAAATARASLLGAASLQWRLPVDELAVADGVVSHPSGKSARYGDLAVAAGATPPGEVQLKERQRWKLLGRPAQRVDVPAKCNGSAVHGIDVRVPGMKFAVVRFSPSLHGQVQRLDASRATALAGAERIVQFPPYAGAPGGFAVIGKTSWHAARAAAAVDVEWAPPAAGGLPDSGRIAADLEHAAVHGDGFVFYERGSADVTSAGGSRLEATYSAPYLAHATMEPMNCTCLVDGKHVELWVPTQVPQLCGEAAAKVAGVDPGDVAVHATLLGGGFGRRLEVDYAAIATRVAMDVPGVPVQVLWPREEDMRHDYYRPMQVAHLQAQLDPASRPVALRIQSAGDAITPRWLRRILPSGLRDVISVLQVTAPTLPGVRAQSGPLDLPDRTASEGLFDLPYSVPNLRVSHVATKSGVPVGFWRSVGHSHNAFFAESFVDELAHAARADPVEYRRSLLRDAPRYRAVLDLAARQAGWGTPLPRGRARGIALHESFGTIAAQVAEVSIENGTIRVHRVVCALDCGTVVNPGIVAQQIEGAVIYGLTAALHGRIDIREGQVQQANFTDYRMLGAAQAPAVETWIVPSERPPAGVGEPGVPPLAPAVANALFVLTGQRLRSLPLQLSS